MYAGFPAGSFGYLVLCRLVQRLVERCELFHIDFSKRKYGSSISAKDIVPNEFRFYKIGRCGIPSADCVVWMGSSWRLNCSKPIVYSFRGTNTTSILILSGACQFAETA